MLRWYVIQSKPQKESFLNDQLSLRGIETYYPKIRVNPVNPRSKKVKPYFPGYLFLRVDLEKVGSSTLNWIPGASSLVSYGDEPAFVSDTLVQSIRRRIDDRKIAGKDVFKHGDEITIHSGPFMGYRAIFDSRLKGNERVRVLLEMLQDRRVCVELSRGQIERIQ